MISSKEYLIEDAKRKANARIQFDLLINSTRFSIVMVDFIWFLYVLHIKIIISFKFNAINKSIFYLVAI